MSTKFEIKLLTVDDLAVYKNIRLEALKTNPEAYGGTYEEESQYSDKEFENTLSRIDNFGIFDNNSIIGILGFEKEKLKKIEHNGNLTGLYITPGYRNKQVGSMLLTYVIDYAKDKVRQLCLHCISENQQLIKFYEKHGFITIGIYPDGMKLGNKFYDTNTMFLRLDC